MATRYVCDHCGYEGSDPEDPPVDQILCPMCGEPATPAELANLMPPELTRYRRTTT